MYIRSILGRSWVKNGYFACKRLSGRHIYPYFPRLHDVIFTKLKAKIRRLYFKSLEQIATANIELLSAYSSCEITGEYNPKVSVIVPNYCHGAYLRKRLDTVYGQSYQNIEVILLDDASSDDSIAILDEYYRAHPNITIRHYNQLNSGGVFRQWRTGLGLASGDLIWIAESDDYCSENFLFEIVQSFRNQAVMLAYARTEFVGGETPENIWTLEEYLEEIDVDLWKNPFVAAAHHLVTHAWAIKNIIPNVSSAVFRHPVDLGLLADESWAAMQICGDWVFYLHVIRGGLVAYTPRTTNYYRIHSANTSTSTYAKDDYYKEHARVAETLSALYRLDADLLSKQRLLLKKHWDLYRSGSPEADFDNCYDTSRVEAFRLTRKPNVMMVVSAFVAGGGETFPIKLATMLKQAGYAISVLNLRYNETEPGIRGLLNKNIPVLELSPVESLPLVVEDMGVEIIHSHHAWADYTVCRLVENIKNTHVVLTTHGMYELMDEDDFNYMLPLLQKRVSAFVYIADKNLFPFTKAGMDLGRFTKIENALDLFAIHPESRADLAIPEDAFVVCLVSRAIPEKGWREAIDAVAQARTLSGCDIHLLLIGEGPEYSRLVAAEPINYIHLLGFKANVRDYFAMSDLGFLPSYFPGESFPLVLIDCLHANRPMLASNVGEIAAMLAGEDGCAGTVFDLVEGRVPVDKVAEIISNYAAGSIACQAHLDNVVSAANKFNPQVMVDKYSNVYCGLTLLPSSRKEQYII